MGLFTIAGVLEGFAGTPWSWAERRAVMEAAVPAGLAWYAWAPKHDPLWHDQWSVPFSDEHLAGFADLLTIEGLHLCICLSPGMDCGPDDGAALFTKLDPVIGLVEAVGSHTPLVLLSFEGLPPDANDPIRHASLVADLSERLDGRAMLAALPSHFAGTVRTDYLAQFSDGLPPDVLVGWSGPRVVNDRIDAFDAEAFSDAVDGRALLLWDNYPVNDSVMSGQLFLRPLRGRDSLLSEFCPAYFANAAVQSSLSMPALLSAAAFCETGEPAEVWDQFEQPVQVALLAEACDGNELFRLGVAATADTESREFDDLWWWLERLEVLEIRGPFGEQAEPWITQANREAELSLVALDLLDRESGDEDVAGLVAEIWDRWSSVRRASVSVFGPRLAIRPTVSVDAAGHWSLAASSAVVQRNVTDLLCAAALEAHTDPSSSA